jgi:Threonine dehydrogenase and related Zn-dependent dehydrogenases
MKIGRRVPRKGPQHPFDRYMPTPKVAGGRGCRGVLVRILRLGLDGTDKEIHAGEYRTVTAGQDILITGDESLGIVEEVGPVVAEVKPCDDVVARVRRGGDSLCDLIDTPDIMTTDDAHYEHGISRVHGFMTEYYVEEPRYLWALPDLIDADAKVIRRERLGGLLHEYTQVA